MKELMDLDLYDLLNIKANAIDSEIKKAYRKKALTCHPDKNPDNPKAVEDFKQLSKAVEILTDRVKRAEYDKVLRERRAANLRRIFVRIAKVPPPSHAARGREETKRSREEAKRNREERKTEYTQMRYPQRRTPTYPPPADKSQNKNGNGPRQNTNSKRDSPHRKKTAPTWPPFASTAQTRNEGGSWQNMKKDSPHRKDTKRTVPTWPPTFFQAQTKSESGSRQNIKKDSPPRKDTKRTVPTWPPTFFQAQTKSEGGSRQNINFKWQFSSILKPATFVAPTMKDGSANNPFLSNPFFSLPRNPTSFNAAFSPFAKSATFVASSNNKASTGRYTLNGYNWSGCSSILKPATFTLPSKN